MRKGYIGVRRGYAPSRLSTEWHNSKQSVRVSVSIRYLLQEWGLLSILKENFTKYNIPLPVYLTFLQCSTSVSIEI